MNKKLYVGNLLYTVSSEDIKELFSEVGEVVYAKVMTRPDGKSKGFGFIEMSSDEEAEAAIEKFDQFNLQDRPLKVSYAKAAEKRDKPFVGAGSFGGRGGGNKGFGKGRSFGGGGGGGRSFSSDKPQKTDLNSKLIKLRRDLKDKLGKER